MHRGRWSPAIDTLCIQHGPRPVYPLALLLVTTRGQPGRRARHGGAKLQAGGGGRACSWPAAPPCAAACSAASASRAQALSATAAFRRVSSARWRPMRRSSSRTSRPTCSSLRAALHRSPYPITLPDNPCAPACARGSTARPTLSPYPITHVLQPAHAAPLLALSTACAHRSFCSRSCLTRFSLRARLDTSPAARPLHQPLLCKRARHARAHCWSSRAARWRSTARVEASRVRPSLLAAPACGASVPPRTLAAGQRRLCCKCAYLAHMHNCCLSDAVSPGSSRRRHWLSVCRKSVLSQFQARSRTL
jgi:hypothetical protein